MVSGFTAFGWGLISAVSLPLGALLGIWLQPKQKINSALMAFGAGALIFALTIELFAHVPHYVHSHGLSAYFTALIGAVAGGLLFDGLNHILNNQGAYLRRFSNAKQYVHRLKIGRAKKLLKELSKITVLSHLPPEHMAQLIHRVHPVKFAQGTKIFSQGDKADEMYFIVSGKVDIILHKEGLKEEKIAALNPNDTFGELGILGNAPRSADAVAAENVRLYKIMKSDFNEFLAKSTELQLAIKFLTETRVNDLSLKYAGISSKTWRQETLAQMEQYTYSITQEDIIEEGKASSKGNPAMAIWLGILIDGVPESLVIGMLAASATGMSYAFIAGVFLANLPEAMSSAVSMKKGGMKLGKILLMWSSICLMTGIGAFFGAELVPGNPTGLMFYFVLWIESLAAGAMLTMIAETMLPEAYEQGGTIVGLSTLAGFLTALFVKVV